MLASESTTRAELILSEQVRQRCLTTTSPAKRCDVKRANSRTPAVTEGACESESRSFLSHLQPCVRLTLLEAITPGRQVH